MNLCAIEAVVRRWFTDGEFRAITLADPAAALAEYRPEAREHRAPTALGL